MVSVAVLEELNISGLGVIDQALLELTPGLNVLSGETGAGKTMVAVALGLALGARASSGLIRSGSKELAVEARFRLDPRLAQGASEVAHVHSPSPGHDQFATSSLMEWARDGEIVLARTVGAEGRSSARIGGRLAPVSSLAEVGSGLVEIHGQNQADRLLQPSAQTAFLDRFAGADHLEALAEFRAVHASLHRARTELAALREGAREREREKDLLAHQVGEIEAAGLRQGEMAELSREEARLAHAEHILELITPAEATLGDEDRGVDHIRRAAEALRVVAALDPGAVDLHARLASLVAETEDVLADIRGYRESVELDPARLEEVRERLHLIRSLERKYGDGEEGITAYVEEARRRLSSLEDEVGTRAELEARVALLAAEESRLADSISANRRDAAPRLAGLLTEELQDLGMPGSSLDIGLDPVGPPGSDGAERATFVLSGGPGQPPQALSRVASGGELSRTMLACRSVLADLDDVPTLVFDEVDAGIGGRAAVAVAERLAALAKHRQVVVVTHLAQIAARAEGHFVVTKEAGSAHVHRVEGEERVSELARMLSGRVTDRSLAHARELVPG
jgi:DNA repair protein RecN (Recombination protein N)